ncbi:scopoletin glucosyltransferase-like [Wolffia australiana]
METSEKRSRDHVMIFPLMAKGHTIPLLHLSTALSARGVAVTVVTTPLNSSFIRQSLPPRPLSNINLAVLPFPRHPSLPFDCESTDHLPHHDQFPLFLQAAESLRDPFRKLLHDLSESNSLPHCVISDYFLGWTVHECRRFNIPRVVFHGFGVFSLLLCKRLVATRPHLAAAAAGEETFHVPGTPAGLRLSADDLPCALRNIPSGEDPLLPFVLKSTKAELESWGVLVNSFQELEGEFVPYLEDFYRASHARTWLTGPLCLYHHPLNAISRATDPCLDWLDGRPPRSVVYVSFGSQAHVSEEQMEEVLQGLEMSGQDFILVAKAAEMARPTRGLVIHGWVPQREVLLHPSTGGFLTHCGWNSVLESLSAGVPILAWPQTAEQPLNARLVVRELGAGVSVSSGHGGLVQRGEICKSVKELMGSGEKGRMARKMAEDLGKMAVAAVNEGGSSDLGLTRFIEDIRRAAGGLSQVNNVGSQ